MRLQPSAPDTNSTMTCPKCGVEQEKAPECLRCGIIVAKYKTPTVAADPQPQAETPDEPRQATPGHFGHILRMLPWLLMTGTIVVLFLILRQAPPIQIETDPQAVERIADKMAHLRFAVDTKHSYSLQFNEAELNQWMKDNLAIASAHRAKEAGIFVPPGSAATVQEVQSALKDVRVNLIGNYLRAYTLFTIYGKDISLQLEGTLEAAGGYLRLKPIKGKLGSLPIPSSTLDHVVHQLFDSPQNRDTFQLPPQIESVQIENSTLVVAIR